ncbi:MAG: TIR domain-containing protein [Pseudomonadota bacterium]
MFLSYSREDQVTARRFAQGLEREGLTVWWDATLHSGEAYDQVTEKALREAKAVVVLWSKASVDSRWVRAEATTADRNKTLVPVMIEDCLRPVMFELTHTADLTKWKGDGGDPLWQAYVADVRRFVHRDGASAPAQIRAPAQARTRDFNRGFNAKGLGIIALAILGTAGVLWLVTRPGGQPVPPIPPPVLGAAATVSNAARASVAVMPFANLTGDPSKDYLGDGMAEELINVLTKVPGLTVPSRTSSFAYKGRNTDLKQIARDLNVGTILEGSVRSAGETIRVTAQLIDAQTDRHLWSETYDRKSADLFKLQDDLAHEIVTAFKTTMNADLPEIQTQAQPTKDVEAYRLYLQALAQINRNSDASLGNAVDLLEKATARDPGFAKAYLALANARGLHGDPLADIERDGRKAIALDPSLANTAKAVVFANVEAKRRNWGAAEEIFRTVVPGSKDPSVLNFYVLSVLWPTGQLQRVLQVDNEAYRLAPGSGAIALQIGMANASAGRDADAIKYAEAASGLGVDSAARRSKQLYSDNAARAGRFNEAADLMVSILPDRVRALGGEDVVRLVYAAMGDPARKPAAVAALHGLTSGVNPEDWVMKVWAMNWFTKFGALDRAYELADQLHLQFSDRSPTNAWAWLWTPEMRGFRQDTRFQAFTTRLGLMDFWLKYSPPDECELKSGKLTCH